MSNIASRPKSTSSVRVIVGTGDPIEETDLVQFRLLYSGQLLGSSKTDTRASVKHQIRLELHPQLKRLWETNPSLLDLARFNAQKWKEDNPGIAAERELPAGLSDKQAECWLNEELARLGRCWIAKKWERAGRGYIPLVTEEMVLRCSIDVLFLRPEEPGMIVKSGDLDNRMKTLFDALRIPANLAEAGGKSGTEDDEPVHCLLEDDQLISEVRIVTDHLLMLPHTHECNPNDVFLVIDVKLNPMPKSLYKFWMA